MLEKYNQGLKTSANTPVYSHEIDYEIHGSEMQFVEITLDPGESAVAESQVMMYYEEGISMQAQMGDSSYASRGVFSKLFKAAKRSLSGEKIFMVMFTNKSHDRKKVAFSAPYPGKIVSFDLAQLGGKILCQKGSFLCAARGVAVDVGFQFNMGAALFGGMGFVLQKIHGDGLAFLHSGGTITEKELAPNEVIYVDTGSVVAIQPSVQVDIKFVGGMRNIYFSGEGLYITKLVGPGKAWIQSLPFSRLRGAIISPLIKKK